METLFEFLFGHSDCSLAIAPFVLGSLITGVAGLIGSTFTSINNARANKKMQSKQNDFNMEMMDKMNEYNLPINQKNRLEMAGINPNFQDGVTSGMQDTPVQSADYTPLPVNNPVSDLTNLISSVSNAMLNEEQGKYVAEKTKEQETVNKYIDQMKQGEIKLQNVQILLGQSSVNLSRKEAKKCVAETKVLDESLNNLKRTYDLIGEQINTELTKQELNKANADLSREEIQTQQSMQTNLESSTLLNEQGVKTGKSQETLNYSKANEINQTLPLVKRLMASQANANNAQARLSIAQAVGKEIDNQYEHYLNKAYLQKYADEHKMSVENVKSAMYMAKKMEQEYINQVIINGKDSLEFEYADKTFSSRISIPGLTAINMRKDALLKDAQIAETLSKETMNRAQTDYITVQSDYANAQLDWFSWNQIMSTATNFANMRLGGAMSGAGNTATSPNWTTTSY